MSLLLKNAVLVDIDPPQAAAEDLQIQDGTIVERGHDLPARPDDERVDCGGAVVMPGLVNGHTHLYSALAVGMPPPSAAPRNFLEILERVWWRLDQALDAESIEASAQLGALDAVHCGTTTLIDHHASPRKITGSLDLVERGLSSVGMRGVLCYETTDRHGPEGCEAGLEENRRYLEKIHYADQQRFAGLVGAHAAFTLEDHSLDQLVRLGRELDSGIHIHVAEDPCDEDACRRTHQVDLIDRLAGHGLLRPESVFAHGTHLHPEAVQRVNSTGLTMAHNARSNMNNAVGYAPVEEFTGPVMLGTDGIGEDMLAEAKQAWFISRHEQVGLSPDRIVGMLAAAARRASSCLGLTLGKLQPGAAADIVITDHHPATPITNDNVCGHLLFSLDGRHVKDVLIDGHWVLRERTVTGCDELQFRRHATGVAHDLWQRMATI